MSRNGVAAWVPTTLCCPLWGRRHARAPLVREKGRRRFSYTLSLSRCAVACVRGVGAASLSTAPFQGRGVEHPRGFRFGKGCAEVHRAEDLPRRAACRRGFPRRTVRAWRVRGAFDGQTSTSSSEVEGLPRALRDSSLRNLTVPQVFWNQRSALQLRHPIRFDAYARPVMGSWAQARGLPRAATDRRSASRWDRCLLPLSAAG
jgi:hypothetical protein